MKHKSFIYVTLLAAIFISSVACSQTKKQSGIHFLPADKSNVSIFIVLDELPKQFFLYTVPEIFTLQEVNEGLFNADLKPWSIKGNTAKRKVANKFFEYNVMMTLHEEANVSELRWTISFKNKSEFTLKDLNAFNCLTMDRAPMFKDTVMERTFVRNEAGKIIKLQDVERVTGNGRRTMQFYPAVGGVDDLAKIPWITGWNVTSPAKLSGKSMWVESLNGDWRVETTVNEQPAYFFNNWEPDHGCIHSSPLLSRELPAGQTAEASGSFKFIKLNNSQRN